MEMININEISDSTIFDEATLRLQKRFKQKHGVDFIYGSFKFIIHEAKLFLIEDWFMDKSFFSSRMTIKKGH